MIVVKNYGCQIYLRQIVTKKAWEMVSPDDYAAWRRHETDEALAAIFIAFPDAKYRIGCECCYGDGPDINVSGPNAQINGDMWFEYSINFDYEKPESEHV